MHAVLLTVLALAGGDTGYPMNDHNVAPAGFHGGCDSCGGANSRYRQPHFMMPQTCYNPKYGCYGSDRYTNRYPAFHGTYYRRPYNYRNVFDYPWHADLHEPTSYFSYHVNAANQQQPAAQPLVPGAIQHPLVPTPAAENASNLRTLRR